ncbi:uncharacterized protein ACN2A1_009633 [Glossina fuscipes fuscipes]
MSGHTCAVITVIYWYISDVAEAKSRGLSTVICLCVCGGRSKAITRSITSGNSKLREFFPLDLVKDLVRTCTERRPNYDRIIIWLTMMALTLALFVMASDNIFTVKNSEKAQHF